MSTAASVLCDATAFERSAGGEHFIQHAAERPDIGTTFRQAEIQDLDRAVRPHFDVGRFQVPMDDAKFVRGFESISDLPGNGTRVSNRKRATLDDVGERLPFDELHHQRAVFDGVDVRDMRMVQRRERVGLALESREPFAVIRERIRKNFECNVAIKSSVARTVHLPHAADAERAGDLELTYARPGGETHERIIAARIRNPQVRYCDFPLAVIGQTTSTLSFRIP